MDGKVLRPKSGGSGQGKVLEPIQDDVEYQIVEEKVDLEIRKVLRIKPNRLGDVMTSFALWAKQFE